MDSFAVERPAAAGRAARLEAHWRAGLLGELTADPAPRVAGRWTVAAALALALGAVLGAHLGLRRRGRSIHED